jgi:OmpA-OmpF porin, OOP family
VLAAAIWSAVMAIIPIAQAKDPWVRNTIYFDPDTVTIGVVAREIISDLAKEVIREGATKVIIVGHCDTADKAPTLLSRYRAKGIADVMRANGVPASVVIEASGVGSSQLAVKTGPNIRQPHNRRATIAF